MNNTFILNGWLDSIQLPKNPKILVCTFASPVRMKRWERKMYQWRTGKTVAVPEIFPQQLQEHNVLMLNGGDTPTLIDTLNRIKGWREHLHDKYIFAFSAGISALTCYSFNVDYQMILKGLGILPFKSIVHYNPYKMWIWKHKLEQHQTYENLPLLLVQDNQYYVIKQNRHILEFL